jgi:hypothetical protein
MLTLRLHLDRADAANGALLVLPGTHALGRLPDDWIVPPDAQERAVVCEAEAGDVLAFRPLYCLCLARARDRVIGGSFRSNTQPRPSHRRSRGMSRRRASARRPRRSRHGATR